VFLCFTIYLNKTHVFKAYLDSLNSLAELVIAGKHKLGCELPLSWLLIILEILRQFLSMHLIFFLEALQHITSFTYFVNGFLNLTLEQLIGL